MLQLESVELREICLPLKEPFRISSGVTTTRRILLLELTTTDGVSTWSECVAGDLPNYSPETIDTAWLALVEWFVPRVLGVEFAGPGEMDAALRSDVRGHEMARAALEMGAWALEAAQRGESLSRVLGGSRTEVETGISLGIQAHPDELVARAADALEEGYRKIKIKIKPGSDLEFLRAARRELGDDAPLMADANNAYSLADIDHLVQLDELGLVMIEQPLAWDDVIRHSQLQARLETPVCLDESITCLARAEDMIAYEAGRIINIKPGRVGGFTESKAIHDLCAANGIPVWCGGMLESGIGRAYNVALASLDNFTIPGDVSPSARYWERDIVEPEWTMQDGRIAVPEAAGIGVAVDRDRIVELSTRSQKLARR